MVRGDTLNIRAASLVSTASLSAPRKLLMRAGYGMYRQRVDTA